MRSHRLRGRLGSSAPKLLTTGGVVLAGLAARGAAKKSWERIAREPAPDNPAQPGVGWGRALAFTVAVAVCVGIARLVAREQLSRRLERFG